MYNHSKIFFGTRHALKISFLVICAFTALLITQYGLRFQHGNFKINIDWIDETKMTTHPTEVHSPRTCKIPQLDPFDSSIKIYTDEKTEPPKCHEKYPLVFELGLNFTLIRNENTQDWKNCCYKTISRPTRDDDNIDRGVIFSDDCIPMKENRTEIPKQLEFIAVYCDVPERHQKALKSNKTFNLIDGFAFVPTKNLRRKIISMKETTNSSAITNDSLNLVVFGIDGVSRMGFLRTMPRVHNYLLNNLSAIAMENQVIVGDNTYPNMLAALMNRTVLETKRDCEKNRFYDECPFIWKEFGAKGYVTGYTEDGPNIAAFNYGKRGFKQPPTDYYFRPLSIMFNTIYSDLRGDSEICYGPRLAFEILLNYMQKFAISMKEQNRRYFHFSWTSTLTHGLLNTVTLGEAALLETLQWFRTQDLFNETLFVLMSDHGFRRKGIIKTEQGKVEHKLPFLYFVFPQWFKHKYSVAVKNVMENSKKLTSPFDLYATFQDILDLENIQNAKIKDRELEMLQSKRITRGISMFVSIPRNRGCEMAGVTEHYCLCLEKIEISVNNSLVIQAVDYTVFHLNSLVAKHQNCSYLSLKGITKAYKILDEKGNKRHQGELFKVYFVTLPGSGKFEATVSLKNEVRRNWSVVGISRVNLYGNQSHCVNEKLMKNYCYCVDLLTKL